ncbi:MAG: NAD(P)-dependent alcohol dehydrogenase [Rubrobacteraceae bacterium]
MEREKMRAVVARGHGGPKVLRVEEVERPEAGEDQLLVKVRAAGVNPIDWRLRRGELRPVTALKRRRIPGRDVAGEVVYAGDRVEAFDAGNRVYAMLDGIFGGYAEYAVVNQDAVAAVPENLSYEEAAATPLAALTAIQALRGALRDLPHDCDEALGRRRVLINGASGGVGTFAVQLARIFGAEVTAVCSAKNLGLVKELGADHTLDYAEEDFTRSPGLYDVIFDVAGNKGFPACRRALRPGGIYVTTEPKPAGFLWQALTFPGENRKARVVLAKTSGRDLDLLKDLFEAGQVRAVMDRTYPMAEAAEAHAYCETGHVRGKVSLLVGRSGAGTAPNSS